MENVRLVIEVGDGTEDYFHAEEMFGNRNSAADGRILLFCRRPESVMIGFHQICRPR